ncbi:uncharacterized protein BYT42DRAFT_269879 [Radiomyces spectabilis]|uniref:uncharacterized protein n=1 Tax=Radiomyces spectabilis TaxID=64574 RepID=UPI002220E8E3|nr:uncharacterized protein BYT42DRAFT_269879 [Radiomyces spectabilis]KAI8384671.1 hypothetical protein BYT42DRAFT_269879 [Radiomyces spectabilis]
MLLILRPIDSLDSDPRCIPFFFSLSLFYTVASPLDPCSWFDSPSSFFSPPPPNPFGCEPSIRFDWSLKKKREIDKGFIGTKSGRNFITICIIPIFYSVILFCAISTLLLFPFSYIFLFTIFRTAFTQSYYHSIYLLFFLFSSFFLSCLCVYSSLILTH